MVDPINPKKYDLSRISTQPKPLIALICMGACYGLVGWHCSAYNPLWNIGSWAFAIGLTYLFLWRWRMISRAILRGPKTLVSMLALSLTLTMAISFSRLFLTLILVVSSTIFTRLELQGAGLNRFWTLVTLSIVSGGMIGLGWVLGKTFYPGSPYWLWSAR